MWRFKSFTYWFNFFLIGVGLFAPNLSDTVRTLLVSTGIANVMLREKTQRKILENDKRKIDVR